MTGSRVDARKGLRFVLLVLLTNGVNAFGQTGFEVQLRLDFSSAEAAVDLYAGRSGNPATIAQMRGSQIALATTGLLDGKHLSTDDLIASLEGAKFNNLTGDDVFHMRDARQRAPAIRAIIDQCKRHNFSQKVVSTVEQLFPDDVRIKATMPVYFVAFGHNNIDAYVRRVVWNGNTPVFVGEGEGELSIVVNLSKAATYQGPVEEQFIELLTVVAHEVFHVAFGLHQDASPTWQRYFAAHRGYFDDLLELTQNEGIAYYLNLVQHYRGILPYEWVQQLPGSIQQFNRSAAELMSPRTSSQRAGELIRASNLSGSHKESYGAFIGMIVARQIDRVFGRDALRETIARGPFDFFGKYIDAMKQDSNLPALSDDVIRYISARR
jgi:hypothetical protein